MNEKKVYKVVFIYGDGCYNTMYDKSKHELINDMLANYKDIHVYCIFELIYNDVENTCTLVEKVIPDQFMQEQFNNTNLSQVECDKLWQELDHDDGQGNIEYDDSHIICTYEDAIRNTQSKERE